MSFQTSLEAQLGHPRILVLGDAMLDRYTWGNAERVSPEAPVLILRTDEREVRLGGAASVASLLRSLEADVTLAAVLGDDHDGRTICRLIDESGIDGNAIVVDASRPTTTKERFLGRSDHRQPHQMLRVDTESRTPLDESLSHQLSDLLAEIIPQYAAVLISDYGKGVCTVPLVASVIGCCQRSGVPVLVDPARGVDFTLYRVATLLKPNRLEAELSLGHPIRSPAEALDAANELRDRYEVEIVVITLDRDGLVFATSDCAEHQPLKAREICDITGAGNTVLATLGLGLAAQGSTLHQSRRVAGVGASPPPVSDAKGISRHSGGVEAPTPATRSDEVRSPGGRGACRAALAFDDDSLDVFFEDKTKTEDGSAGASPSRIQGLRSSIPFAEIAALANVAAGLQVAQPGVAPVTRTALLHEFRSLETGRVPLAMPVPLDMLQRQRGDGRRESKFEDTGTASGTQTIPDGRRASRSSTASRTQPTNPTTKLISLESATAVAEEHRQAGRRIVFTNGCFDLLHVGHVAMLEQASQFGDVLIVAINSDDSVRRLKGETRPVISARDRARMLAALACVDHVLIFDDATPHALLDAIRPDVLVKGGTTAEIVGREVVEAYGGQIRQTAESPGVSTTALLAEIQATETMSTRCEVH